MKTFLVSGMIVASLVLSGCASTVPLSELDELFAPYGYDKIKETKKQCEVRFQVPCVIYGGYGPKMEERMPEPAPKKDSRSDPI